MSSLIRNYKKINLIAKTNVSNKNKLIFYKINYDENYFISMTTLFTNIII